MLSVKIGDKEFGIVFKHTPHVDVPKELSNSKRKKLAKQFRRSTECSIYEIERSNGVISRVVVGVGKAECSLEDNFNKEQGRQDSLRLALRSAREYGHELFVVDSAASAHRVQQLEKQFFEQYALKKTISTTPARETRTHKEQGAQSL